MSIFSIDLAKSSVKASKIWKISLCRQDRISYSADGKRLMKVGVNYDSSQCTIGDWIVREM